MGAQATSSMGRTVSPSVASKKVAPFAFSLRTACRDHASSSGHCLCPIAAAREPCRPPKTNHASDLPSLCAWVVTRPWNHAILLHAIAMFAQVFSALVTVKHTHANTARESSRIAWLQGLVTEKPHSQHRMAERILGGRGGDLRLSWVRLMASSLGSALAAARRPGMRLRMVSIQLPPLAALAATRLSASPSCAIASLCELRRLSTMHGSQKAHQLGTPSSEGLLNTAHDPTRQQGSG